MAAAAQEGAQRFGKGVYFIGKVVWAKGYTELLDLMTQHEGKGKQHFHVDVYGNGEDLDAVKATAQDRRLSMTFHGARDHLDRSIHDYKVFVNPSTSDVVATTTAEALAMGKFVVVPDLPCNQFFSTFKNCLIYRSPEEFSQCLKTAVESEPAPMTKEASAPHHVPGSMALSRCQVPMFLSSSLQERHRLTWEAATERFLEVADVDEVCKKGPAEVVMDNVLAAAHNTLTGVEAVRRELGAGSNTKQAPANLLEFVPPEDEGGFFDAKSRAQEYYKK